ncbi:MAG: hypothetical protein HZB51_26235 [Chloroflexi bacterium]|nr:hypothetical protein [Chloroflexota bacterium]
MKLATGFFLVLGALPLVVYPFVLLANIMGLAGQWSGNESLVLILISYAFYIGTTVYPLVYLICVGAAIVAVRRKSNRALGFALGSIGYLLLLVGLVAIWALVEQGISTFQGIQEQGNASPIAKCTPSSLVDGEDGLRTTGCGALEVGKTGAGVIGNPLEAHNWEFKVKSSYRMTITVKNDRKSCPTVRILDLSGRNAPGFDEQKPPICLDGMVITSFFYFNPSSNDPYIIRVFTPKTPGAYSIKIE